jgi:hypothetical protein
MASVQLVFKVSEFQPGSRGYNKPTLIPDNLQVVINVPLQHEYIANAEQIITANFSSSKAPNPILTLAGWVYVEDLFLNRAIVTEPEQPAYTDDDFE